MTAKTTTIKDDVHSQNVEVIAKALTGARHTARGIADYPGAEPADLASAYLIQDRAIELWGKSIGGWKVGRIPPAVEDQFGCDRLAGPIFSSTIVHQDNGDTCAMPVFAEGGAAVEAEFVAVIAKDAPDGKSVWSRDEADAMVQEIRIGLEIASSPLTGINDRGPAVVVSDFGNNLGLIVGPAIPGWKDRDPDSLTCATYIDDELVGEGGAYGLTGGITRSVQFILELAASRGMPLRSGDVIATGQTTGIHDVTLGQAVRMPFGDASRDGQLVCTIVAAEPH
jgi:2-keto-4-pentenoate hydratase